MFPRYPDFYKEHDYTIIDAKYKVEINNREDVHQMITYMYRLRGKYGIFIQPTSQEDPLRKTYYLQGSMEQIKMQNCKRIYIIFHKMQATIKSL